MKDLIETDGYTASRKETGSKVSISRTQFDRSQEAFVYENGTYGLKIGFPALYVYETFPLVRKKVERVVQQPLCVGVVLIKEQLKDAIRPRVSASAPSSTVDDLVRDVHELLLGLLRGNPVLKFYHFDSEVPVHIYEAEVRRFWDTLATHSDTRKLRPEEISILPATLVM